MEILGELVAGEVPIVLHFLCIFLHLVAAAEEIACSSSKMLLTLSSLRVES